MSIAIWRFVALAGSGVLFTCMLGLLVRKPEDKARRLLVNAASGFVVMLAINTFLPAYGISVPLNFMSAAAASIFGIPGVALTAALNAIL